MKRSAAKRAGAAGRGRTSSTRGVTAAPAAPSSSSETTGDLPSVSRGVFLPVMGTGELGYVARLQLEAMLGALRRLYVEQGADTNDLTNLAESVAHRIVGWR